MNGLEDFFKNPIKSFQEIIKMKPEEAEAVFKQLNAELEIRIGLAQQQKEAAEKEEKRESKEPPKDYPIPPDQWI